MQPQATDSKGGMAAPDESEVRNGFAKEIEPKLGVRIAKNPLPPLRADRYRRSE